MKDFTTVKPLQGKDRGIGRELTHFMMESWIKDQIPSMKGMEYGKEEASSAKIINKHRTMEYSSIVQMISAAASELENVDKLDGKPITNRDSFNILTRELKHLKNKAYVYSDPLVMAIKLYGYNRELGQFLAWILEMMADARSEDIRHEYEHLDVLQAMLQNFEFMVEAGDKDMCSVDVKEIKVIQESCCPGGEKGQSIAQQQKMVTQSWYLMQKKALEKKASLMFSNDFINFLERVGNLLAWFSGTRSSQIIYNVKDAQSSSDRIPLLFCNTIMRMVSELGLVEFAYSRDRLECSGDIESNPGPSERLA